MQLNISKLKFIIALLVMLGVAFICSSNKDDKKEDTKKEDTKEETKDDTKKETTKEETTTTESGSFEGSKLYFCEQYTSSGEVGVSDVFTIPKGGGYLTVMIDLRPSGKKINVGKVDLRISKLTGSKEKIVETIPFDVQPSWDYIHFDEITFYSSGTYKVTLLKPDGSPVCTGEVEINYR